MRSLRHTLAAAIAVAVAVAGCGDGGKEAPTPPKPASAPTSTEVKTRPLPPILEKAIAWHGGIERLSTLKTATITASGKQMGRPYSVTTRFDRDGSLRSDLEIHDALISQVITPEGAWATFDGVRMPLEPGDREAMLEGLRTMRLSLLADLAVDSDVAVEDRGMRNGKATLEVRWPKAPKGPYTLSFDDDGRLHALAWKTPVFGYRGSQASRIEILRWGDCRGVKIALETRLSIDGDVVQHETVSAFDVDTTLAADVFAEPPATAEPPVFDRVTSPTTAAWMRAESLDDGSEERLAKWIERQGWRRAGPTIRTLPDAETRQSSVMIALDLTDPDTRPATRPQTRPAEGPRVRDLPSMRVLALATSPGKNAVDDAAKRLAAAAAERGLVPAGPLRLVAWSADRLHVQLPVRGKS